MSRHLTIRFFVLLVLLGSQLASAATDRFILVPDQDGSTGAIQVTSPKGTKVIKKPYSMIKVDAQGNFIVVKSNILCVGTEFDNVLSFLPKPKNYTLTFSNGQTLDSEAEKVLQDILLQMASVNTPFVVLSGGEALIKAVQSLLLQSKISGLAILLDVVPDTPNATTVPQVKVSVQ